MERRTLSTAVFLVLAAVVMISALYYGTGFTLSKEKIPLTPQQQRTVDDCRDGLHDTTLIQSNVVCFPTSRAKSDIALFSTYPVSGAFLMSELYQRSTHLNAYSQYKESSSHIQACNFQTGPWNLFCRQRETDDGRQKCLYHRPDEITPYFVGTNYPVNSKMCEEFGFPLPRHELVIHMVRNPVDNISGWINYDFGGVGDAEFWHNNRTVQQYIDEYAEWHKYWRDYHRTQPSIPTMWIRQEDFCLCRETVLRRILEFTSTPLKETDDTLRKILRQSSTACPQDTGVGMSFFSLEQFYYIRDKFDFVIQQFGYKKLIHEFEKHLENPQSKGANKAYHKALWKNTPYGSAPSDEFCESLISVEWDWGNKL